MLFEGRGLARAVAEYIFAEVPSQLFVAQKLVREIGLLWIEQPNGLPPIGVNLRGVANVDRRPSDVDAAIEKRGNLLAKPRL